MNQDFDRVEVVDYDPSWHAQFEEEANRIVTALGAHNVAAIDHIGSTAVAGIAAKPVIDILVALKNTIDLDRAKDALNSLGYDATPPGPPSDLIFAVKRDTNKQRTHHIHVVAASRERDYRIVFRDQLRANPTYAKAYESLKRDLASRFRDDRIGYMDGKNLFIEAVLQKADTPELVEEARRLARQLNFERSCGQRRRRR